MVFFFVYVLITQKSGQMNNSAKRKFGAYFDRRHKLSARISFSNPSIFFSGLLLLSACPLEGIVAPPHVMSQRGLITPPAKCWLHPLGLRWFCCCCCCLVYLVHFQINGSVNKASGLAGCCKQRVKYEKQYIYIFLCVWVCVCVLDD